MATTTTVSPLPVTEPSPLPATTVQPATTPTTVQPATTPATIYTPWNPNPANPAGTIYARPGASPSAPDNLKSLYQRYQTDYNNWEKRQDDIQTKAALAGIPYKRQTYGELKQYQDLQTQMWQMGYDPFGATGSSTGSSGGGAGSGGASGGGAGSGGAVPGGLMNYAQQAAAFYQQAMGIGANGQPTTVETRTPGEQELAAYWLEKLLDPDSPLAQRAMQTGRDEAAGRGLMNSSIAGGNAYGAWVDRVQPYALDASGVHARTAAENMAARNVGYMLDSQNNQQDEEALRQYLLGSATDFNRANLNVEAREDTQGWQSGENAAAARAAAASQASSQGWQSGENAAAQAAAAAAQAAGQGWQTGERLGTQQFSAEQQAAINAYNRGERVETQNWNWAQQEAVNAFQWQRDQLDAQMKQAGLDQNTQSILYQVFTNLAGGYASSTMQAVGQAMANTDLTPVQQQAATNNILAIANRLFPTIPFPTAPTSGYTPSAYQPTPPPTTNTAGLSYNAYGEPVFSYGQM